MNARWIAVLPMLLVVNTVYAKAEVTSREYKWLLEPTQFTFQNEESDVERYTQQAANSITQTIDRDVTGQASLNKERLVSYWDVPNTCTLRDLGYSLRERSNAYDPDDREATLKYRSVDRFVSAYEDLDSDRKDAESKLEDDLVLGEKGAITIKVSHSTTLPDYGKTINKVDDIYDDFPGFKDKYGDIDADVPLQKVGGVTFYERRYKGQQIDLGQFDADLVISLWYTSADPQPDENPVIAEASFDYADAQGEYTPKVVQRAQQAFIAMGQLTPWAKLDGITKTQFAYQYNPSFCQ